jgi:hypothetical protein
VARGIIPLAARRYIDLFTDLGLECRQDRLEKQGEFTRLHLDFPDRWQKKHLECPIK